ncbi:metal-dependent hydrolase [Kozakia baliensis]|uniref:Uncharacterized protein n=1 Tax=Kozakia baliensis TaxID=153496 RepID=A0A1D8UT92_9PROT|nr:metal-dependent hydrolase [Kozakia baliensis]AOX16836.1 hypothetical protein A0U89_06485 [Kozakia baliensis]GEL64728.1 hypothetical protein KBA01_20140 [Kozakia baliensis]
MTGRSHMLIGAATAIAACAGHWLVFSPATIFAAIFGSLLPDLDTERSMLGCRVRWLSRRFAAAFGHRTVTHSFFVPLVGALMVWHFEGLAALRGFWGAIWLGYASHIAADLPTGGCWALYPLSNRRLAFWPYARTGGIQEAVLLMISLGLLMALAFVWTGQVQHVHLPRNIASMA